jgi:hypothetical protein
MRLGTMRLGTMGWIERTGGRLAWQERLTLIAQGVRARVATAMGPRSGRIIRLREINDIQPPDSSITREATALLQDLSKPFLFNHCIRSHFWAHLLDEDPKPFDNEAVFTALMLHDLGLTEHGRRAAEPGNCFTQVGAQKAYELAGKHGWSDRRAELTANAITLHLTVIVAERHGKEAKMVRVGTGADAAVWAWIIFPAIRSTESYLASRVWASRGSWSRRSPRNREPAHTPESPSCATSYVSEQ